MEILNGSRRSSEWRIEWQRSRLIVTKEHPSRYSGFRCYCSLDTFNETPATILFAHVCLFLGVSCEDQFKETRAWGFPLKFLVLFVRS